MARTSEEQTDDAPSRMADCAAMLIAVTRMMLDVEPKAFASWLRAIADDIEAEADQLGRGEHSDRPN